MHEYTKYFKNQLGFDRFIQKLYQKYQSLSKFSGTIKLEKIKKEEAIVLSRLFGTTYHENETITISIKKFLSIMEISKYTDFNINNLIEEYLNIKLITKKEVQDTVKTEEEEFYQSIIGTITTTGTNWLKEIITTKQPPYKLIHQRYHKNKKYLKKELTNIITLINHLPQEKILLPIYASNYTKDPHYLDLDNKHSNLFFYALAYIHHTSYPNNRAEKIQLLSKSNIEIDTVSNYAITYKLLSAKLSINLFAQNNETLILNIQNIISTKFFDTSSKKVFIFENPSILTEIISKNINASVIISSGFPNTSVHLLIDALIKTGNQIYYNGDFDPEGLIIASKLKEKYQDNLTLFCYDKIDYQNCISKKKINATRLNKLSKITTKELLDIKELLLKDKYSAYQENNKERIIQFIRQNI